MPDLLLQWVPLYYSNVVLFLVFVAVVLLLPMCFNYDFLPAIARPSNIPASKMATFPRGLIINDNNLRAELVARGLKFPTSMAFLGPNDILVNEKLNGTVQRIIDGKIQPQSVLDVSVASQSERGMFGIVVAKPNSTAANNSNKTSPRHVFVSFTETKVEGSDICPNLNYCVPGHDPIGNRLYKYEFDNNSGKLVNPKLLLDLPALPGPPHNGGKIIIGPDNNVYVTIGDVGKRRTQAENSQRSPADGSGGILRITQDGQIAHDPPLGNTIPLGLYYAYGIRNSFGMDFDPVTGNLWDTENGPTYGDEINLVQPGFNSGWTRIQGFWQTTGNGNYYSGKFTLNPTGLVDFGGKGKYRSPEFVWLNTTGPTAIKFLNSDKLGKQYQNDMFVADYHGGNIYHFKLNQNRTALLLNGPLADKVANTPSETQQGGIIFAKGFGAITDLEVGPYDGYLYVLTFDGSIYRIVPSNSAK
jgi:aldose sugar dehydrogenase